MPFFLLAFSFLLNSNFILYFYYQQKYKNWNNLSFLTFPLLIMIILYNLNNKTDKNFYALSYRANMRENYINYTQTKIIDYCLI
ncbi:unnamed protein product [Blepharisma stoltei]|uniref:Uncharacterized protein n=1 Tax=Blepharisma stoltei TaxID=1481888 RepID=A0AAU9JHP6_9CILI|nr:unnamed protein product [Blepharisma stoltei]